MLTLINSLKTHPLKLIRIQIFDKKLFPLIDKLIKY